MSIMTSRLAAVIALASATFLPAQTTTGDWPQWRGPDRTGVSRETGLLQEWPSGGPAVAWSASGLGAGYGTVAVKGTRVFVQGLRGRQTMLHSLDRGDGKYLWSKNLGSGGGNDRGSGPRSTPTLDGDRVYVLTETGELFCLREDGTQLWQRNILREFSGSNITWLLSESPLVDGDRLIVTPGGRQAGLVALDKMTGKTIWAAKELNDDAGYSSVVPVEVQGIRAYTTFTSAAAVGVRASDGKVMWRYPQAANGTANITTPVVHGNQVFYTSGYGTGAGLVSLRAQNGELVAQETYFTRGMQNHHGGVVLVNGTIYGFSNAILAAIGFRDRQDALAESKRREGVGRLRGWTALHAQRGQRRRPGRGHTEGLSGNRPLPDCRSGIAELVAPGCEWRPTLHSQPEQSDGV